MSLRPVFFPLLPSNAHSPGVHEVSISFQWYPGLSWQQRQRCVEALHMACLKQYPGSRILEASRFDQSLLGVSLSAFNLCDETGCSVEVRYQTSKVFSHEIGPFPQWRHLPPKKCRDAVREASQGHKLIAFVDNGEHWALKPERAYYNWLYCTTLQQNPALALELSDYNAFTDIAFNPQKSLSCQAYALALYRSLDAFQLLDHALRSKATFLRYHPDREVLNLHKAPLPYQEDFFNLVFS